MICNMCPRHKSCADVKNGCEKCDIGIAFYEERKKYRELNRDFRVFIRSVAGEHTPRCFFVNYDQPLFEKIEQRVKEFSKEKLYVVAFTIKCFDQFNNCIYIVSNDIISDSRFYIRGEDIYDVCNYDLTTILFEHYKDILPSYISTEIYVLGIVEV